MVRYQDYAQEKQDRKQPTTSRAKVKKSMLDEELSAFEDTLIKSGNQQIKPVLTGKGKGSMGSKLTTKRPGKGVKGKDTRKTQITKSEDMSSDEGSSGVTKSENLCKCGAACKSGGDKCAACMSKALMSAQQFVPSINGLTDQMMAKDIAEHYGKPVKL